ncbi:hypothetical protein PaecuDRAFT_4766 [Paenibacillus curdlanolyticus YK9]|uniref:Uncharacterized protein n=1 Tax=Paenibacillus curdlanolyticus YK9 TaxID=717606 RepID=E0IGH3_9BACL|nr:hypothetical protein [Paenibacillus curdlanolyticus]EFM08413.1 hypothetical protein PaecuDRAFT_4766 [Paenibacillus curdlanolyticus YK9]
MMKAWLACFGKELRQGSIMMMSQRIVVGIAVAVLGLSIYLAYRHTSGNVAMLWGVIMMGMVIWPACYMLSSLQRERKRAPLWHQLPLAGWQLLLAKYAAGIVEWFVSLAAATGIFAWMYHADRPAGGWLVSSEDNVFNAHDFADWLLGLLDGKGYDVLAVYLIVGIGLSVLAVLFHTIASLLNNRLGKWRWLAALLILAALIYVDGLFGETGVYASIFQWGASYGSGDEAVYVPEMVWGAIELAALFMLSAWLLDRKAEVD